MAFALEMTSAFSSSECVEADDSAAWFCLDGGNPRDAMILTRGWCLFGQIWAMLFLEPGGAAVNGSILIMMNLYIN